MGWARKVVRTSVVLMRAQSELFLLCWENEPVTNEVQEWRVLLTKLWVLDHGKVGHQVFQSSQQPVAVRPLGLPP